MTLPASNPRKRPVLCPVCGQPVYRHAGLEKCYLRALATLTAKRKAEPRPDFDPHLDYPERYTDGPV
jgi:hypothetical protein